MVRVGRADIQLAVSPRGSRPIQLWAAHIVPCRGKRGGCVQAQPKGVEPALSCAPTSASTSVESCHGTCCSRKMCVPQPAHYHLLRVAPSERGRGRLPLRDQAYCARQAKHDEGRLRRTVCRVRLQKACDAAPGWKQPQRWRLQPGQHVWQHVCKPLAVDRWRLPLADRCDQHPGPRVRFHWSGMAGPGVFSRVLEGV